MTAIDEVRAGSLGYFWPFYRSETPRLNDATAATGYLVQSADELRLTLLSDEPMRIGKPMPIGFIGATQRSGLILTDVVSARGNFSFGGGKASTDQYLAQTLIVEPQIDSVDTLKLASESALFRGTQAMAWAGLTAIDRMFTTDDRHRVESMQINLKSVPDVMASISGTATLTLKASWGSNEDADRGLIIDSGLRAVVESSSPLHRSNLRGFLLHIQDLLGVAFGGHFIAEEGHAQRVGAAEGHPMWTSQLMSPSRGVHEADRSMFPVFLLEHLGGVQGMARWISLCMKHPRAVAPISNRLRHGPVSPEVQTLETAAAIEYWVASNRRVKRAWAAKSHGRDTPAAALARHAGPSFGSWVGDPEKWSKLFWDTYNALKHRPSLVYSRRDMRVLAEVAHSLLTASLLNRVAPTMEPGRQLFSDHRNLRLGHMVSAIL